MKIWYTSIITVSFVTLFQTTIYCGVQGPVVCKVHFGTITKMSPLPVYTLVKTCVSNGLTHLGVQLTCSLQNSEQGDVHHAIGCVHNKRE